jgi:hypothetical protein
MAFCAGFGRAGQSIRRLGPERPVVIQANLHFAAIFTDGCARQLMIVDDGNAGTRSLGNILRRRAHRVRCCPSD